MRHTWWIILLMACCVYLLQYATREMPESMELTRPAEDEAAANLPALVISESVIPLPTALRRIKAGSYRSFFPGKGEPREVQVSEFQIEEHAVTNGQFLRFVRAIPEWRRSRAKRLFAEANYLKHWIGDLTPGDDIVDRPVVNVSWFAARAYARWIDRRLPTVQEWEFVARASETTTDGTMSKDFNQRILDWYSKKTSQAPDQIRSTFKNAYGVYDMHGLVWEWVEDFNSALVTGESRGDTGLDRRLFCGAGSIGSADPKDYASFMRLAFRSSLKAAYTTKNLGFRCADDANAPLVTENGAR